MIEETASLPQVPTAIILKQTVTTLVKHAGIYGQPNDNNCQNCSPTQKQNNKGGYPSTIIVQYSFLGLA